MLNILESDLGTSDLKFVHSNVYFMVHKHPIQSKYYFRANSTNSEIINCPDGSKNFDSIELHHNIAICKNNLPMFGSSFRIYIKPSTTMDGYWLDNPEIRKRREKSKLEITEEHLKTFTSIIAIHKDYIYVGCDFINEINKLNTEPVNKIYIFESKQWVEVPPSTD